MEPCFEPWMVEEKSVRLSSEKKTDSLNLLPASKGLVEYLKSNSFLLNSECCVGFVGSFSNVCVGKLN